MTKGKSIIYLTKSMFEDMPKSMTDHKNHVILMCPEHISDFNCVISIPPTEASVMHISRYIGWPIISDVFVVSDRVIFVKKWKDIIGELERRLAVEALL